MSIKEKKAWIYFKEVLAKYLGNVQALNYDLMVVNIKDTFKRGKVCHDIKGMQIR